MTSGNYIRCIIKIMIFNDHELIDCVGSLATVGLTVIERNVTLTYSFVSEFKNNTCASNRMRANTKELYKTAIMSKRKRYERTYCETKLFKSQIHISRSKQT